MEVLKNFKPFKNCRFCQMAEVLKKEQNYYGNNFLEIQVKNSNISMYNCPSHFVRMTNKLKT